MKSLFFKNFIIYALVVVVSFTALGGAFVFQVNKFAMDEKQNVLELTASRASDSTSNFILEAGNIEQSILAGMYKGSERMYKVNLMQLAGDCGGMIFVCDNESRLKYVASRDGCYSQVTGRLPLEAGEAVKTTGKYSEMGNFYGYLNGAHFILGVPYYDNMGSSQGSVFVAVPADNSVEFFLNITSTFTFMILIVLLVTLAVTYMVVRSTVKPLKQLAEAARAYARGDFSARLRLPSRQDELFDVIYSFNNMADSVENMETLRKGFVANVSHDLRTPMTTIAGFVDGILDGAIKPEKQAYYLKIISEEIKRLSRLASSLLQLSKLESGEQPLNKTKFDMSEMVRRIIIGFEQKLTEKNVDMTLDIPENQRVTADHDAIFQSVYNLIDNAVKFVEQEGQIIIYMSVKNGKMQFNIQNTGSEISQEALKHIFDRFYKEDSSRGMNKNGSGLGLYIAKTVVNRHGGNIYAQSGQGKTEFCFDIPIN